jgi:hypothetical protein
MWLYSRTRAVLRCTAPGRDRHGARSTGRGHLTKGIGFSADAFDEGIVFLGVVTLRLEFIPEALDGGQALPSLL